MALRTSVLELGWQFSLSLRGPEPSRGVESQVNILLSALPLFKLFNIFRLFLRITVFGRILGGVLAAFKRLCSYRASFSREVDSTFPAA